MGTPDALHRIVKTRLVTGLTIRVRNVDHQRVSGKTAGRKIRFQTVETGPVLFYVRTTSPGFPVMFKNVSRLPTSPWAASCRARIPASSMRCR